MVVITCELWPKGDQKKAKPLGFATIANIGGTLTSGDYDVRLYSFNGRRMWKQGKVMGFPRQRLGAWDLMLRALAAIVGSRNASTIVDIDPAPIGDPMPMHDAEELDPFEL